MAHSILTAVSDNPAAREETQEGGIGSGHVSFWHHNMAHWRDTTDKQTHKSQIEKVQMSCYTSGSSTDAAVLLVCLPSFPAMQCVIAVHIDSPILQDKIFNNIITKR